ncbi:cation efflux protein [Kockiozyma suomiensis]|uniref:cation efflux protein n=1 Tax=Kockiozyma suomiensis TaxID=1337062 RepID=UPI0033440C4D
MAVFGKKGRIITLVMIDSLFFLLEVIIGYGVHSLALVADSFHMLNDIFSLVIALWAVSVSKSRAASSEYSYGWQRAEILGALVNGVFLLALCLTIFLEALQRFVDPQIITNPKLVFGVGFAGLISNIVGLFLFHEHGHSHSHGDGAHDTVDQMEIGDYLPDVVVSEHAYETQQREAAAALGSSRAPGSEYETATHDTEATGLLDPHTHMPDRVAKSQKKKNGASHGGQSLNMRGVFLHVMGDALGNIGVMASALFIWFTDYWWRFYFDPLVSLVITAIIFASALPLVKSASKILLQAAPKGIDVDDIKSEIQEIPGVKSVHDFHIWILRENLYIASMHVNVVLGSAGDFTALSKRIRKSLHAYGIHSATIQPEFEGFSAASSQVSLHNSVDSTGSPPMPGPGPECLCVEGCDQAACCIDLKAATAEVTSHSHTHSH